MSRVVLVSLEKILDPLHPCCTAASLLPLPLLPVGKHRIAAERGPAFAIMTTDIPSCTTQLPKFICRAPPAPNLVSRVHSVRECAAGAGILDVKLLQTECHPADIARCVDTYVSKRFPNTPVILPIVLAIADTQSQQAVYAGREWGDASLRHAKVVEA